MSEEQNMEEKKKEEKKPQVTIKLDWIFGIRKDFLPNLFILDKDTIVYPASNYVVILNYTKNMGPLNLQHYIPGTKHSKGIVALSTCNFNRKMVAMCEDTYEGVLISFYNITARQGLKNFPDKQSSFDLIESRIDHTYAITFSKRRKQDNYIVALCSNDEGYYLVCWKWDLETVKDNPNVYRIKIPFIKNDIIVKENSSENSNSNEVSINEEKKNAVNFNNESNYGNNEGKEAPVDLKRHFQIEFSSASMENDSFSLVGNDFVTFYSITSKAVNEVYQIFLYDEEGNSNNYGNEIYNSVWLYDGSFAFITDQFINIFDGKYRQLIQQIENPDKEIRILTPYTVASSIEGFIGCGINKKMQFYVKKTSEEEPIETQNVISNNNENENENENENNEENEGEENEGEENEGEENNNEENKENNEENKENNNEENKDNQEQNKNNNDNNTLNTNKINTNVEKYELSYEKTKYEFVPGVNEKITGDKVLQNDKNSSNERPFDFLTVTTLFDEPRVLATTTNNDLIKINIEEKEINRAQIQYIITPFHSDSIEGMDICINKPYFITCSKDKSVRVWDYQQRIHVISKIFEEELYSITYHPNGMHALVSTEDKIYPLNIFYDEIDNMTQQITTKAKSKDIKFSHMGHLFAFDTGAVVQIWDFLNMQIYTGPPPYGQQKKNFSITSSKINSLSWREDDKNLLASGTEYIYDWKVKDEHDTKPKLTQSNISSATYAQNDEYIIASTEDRCLRKLQKDSQNYISEKYDYSMKELHSFHRNKFLVCATTKYGNQPNLDMMSNQNRDLMNSVKFTTCIRLFPDVIKSNEHIDITAHQGETMRIRVNYEENKIFTCGEDGCINIYSIELPFDSNDPEKYLNEQNTSFTNTVLIKKTRYKERDFDKKELPAKREEKLKKIRSENNDKRETDRKILEEKKNRIVTTKYSEKNIINQMKSDLQNCEIEYNAKIKNEIQSNESAHDTQFNNNQIELSLKTRQVEDIRDSIKQENENYEKRVKEKTENTKRERQKNLEEFEAKKKDLERSKSELEGKIKSLEENKIEDGKALNWLNDQVISEIKKNIDELSHKIDELRVHYSHHIKKQKEEKEKLQQTGDNLFLELKKIEEEKDRQIRNKEKNLEAKRKAEDETAKMTKRITEIENKIIECKKAHTYLEKCKFVLSYKIQELKKEAGPMEKILEDLQKRTKEDELSLSKYNREFDIISQKLVDLEDLKEKTKAHEKTERDLKNEIKSFKIDLFNMIDYIDDYDKLREGFRNLREKYLKNYVPEVQDHEIEGEFANQKSKMKNRVFELQGTMNSLRSKHKDNISDNRNENSQMISKINFLKKTIKEEKKTKETNSGDQKHANAVAEIYAAQIVKKLMLENISIKDKIGLFREKIKSKKEELQVIKKRMNKNGNNKKGYESDNINEINDMNQGMDSF
jgi:hypothetical protein